ncbi:MAG: hypothetical protein RMJ28_07085 [Nitrososphaerota archaeon]|nr:hypothetical protein [Candidatus Calditenuaceae archaeon]MDW8073978.1 hypothetical protein [Nitrososphaerota archaeon]
MAGIGLGAKAAAAEKKHSPEDVLRQIEELREPIERTLMDIREMISALDNPLIGVMEEPPAQPKEHGHRRGQGEAVEPVRGEPDSRAGSEPQAAAPPPPQIPLSHGGSVSRFNATALASLAVWLLGRDTFERLVNALALNSPQSIYLTALLREAADFVSATLRDERVFARATSSHESYLLCVMLLELYLSNPSHASIGMVASLIQRLLSQNGVKGA